VKTKLNKKKIILIIVIMLIVITLPSFGRYVYDNIRDNYLKSRNFSFSSNLLTSAGENYKYANWSGVENYEIQLDLYSYENELSLFTYEGTGLQYKLTAAVNDSTKASVHINSTSGGTTENSYIPNDTNIKTVKIFLKPKSNLIPGETLTLTVTAETTSPYKKKISAKFQITITEATISYKIKDSAHSLYATLEVLNAKNIEKQVKLSFDPSKVMIDTSDEYYINRVSQTTTEISGVEYINSVTIKLEPESSRGIKFYKTEKSFNYTYPGGPLGSMIVTITE